MNIGTHRIGVDPPYVIAEIGSNHQDDLDMAFRLIDMAAEQGADAAKFQLYRADKLYPGTITPGAIPDSWLPQLKDRCASAHIDFVCSVFCLETLNAYMQLDPVAVKIAAPEATHYNLVRAAVETGVATLISTGATTWADLDGLPPLHDHAALLHCVSAYPAPPDEMNLTVLPLLRTAYGCPVGLSDHTLHPTVAPVAAVALGASIIEKHVTFDRQSVGPDHAFAVEPAELGLLVDAVYTAWLMLGDGVKRVSASEDPKDRR